MVAHGQDKITLAGVKIYPHIGTTPEERATSQECLVDLVLWGNFEAAASTDSLEQSIDYVRVITVIEQTAQAREYNLVETLAYKIVRKIFESFPVSRASVKVRKRPEMLRDKLNFVEVEIEES
jgi:7,8-dihydroneopterin aldolase/epimerase/oxygenase